MKITQIRLGLLRAPLRVPFKTAERTVERVEDVLVALYTDTGAVGYGEATPTGVITGDTAGAITGAIRDHISKVLLGRDADALEELLLGVNRCIAGNSSARAAVDMALYDLYGQLYRIPVYKLLGGSRTQIVTDITLSVNSPEEMARDARSALARGYGCLKCKVGKEPAHDLERLRAIRAAAGPQCLLRIDANQGWNARQAVQILTRMQEAGLDIEFCEQPVPAWDIDGLQYVTEHSPVPVLADESVFSARDALAVLQRHAADYINIKLMKCGGIYNALRIASLAEVYGVECMIGAMLETKLSANAAVELACARSIITKIDLDGPVLCSADPVRGGAVWDEQTITVSSAPGMGIAGLDPASVTWLD